MVADILMLKKIIENPAQKAILVLPYVALVQEKLRWLRNIVDGVQKVSPVVETKESASIWRAKGDEQSVRVVGFFGGSKVKATWTDFDIAICTIEKANSLINTAIEECNVNQLGIVVMDELHMLDDGHRGYIMELMATKLLSLEMEEDLQLIGMSATLPNTQLLAKWLNAKYYISNYRPVPIDEHLVYENAIYPAANSKSFYKTASKLASSQPTNSQIQTEAIRRIATSEYQQLASPVLNAVVSLAAEAATLGHGVLVFCSSRHGSEADAKIIAQVMAGVETIPSLRERRQDLLNNLRSTITGLDHVLEVTVPHGVAFHHAGLTTEERELVADAYDNGTIKVLVATCTLAAGINLPARRVILHGARMGRDLIGPSMLRQMRGRAGRKGKDSIGETYLCCQKSDFEAVVELMEAELPNIESCLSDDQRGIERALLEIIATKLATTQNSIDDYMQKTLLFHTTERSALDALISTTLTNLVTTGLISIAGDCFEATLLGEAIVASSIAPSDGIFIHQELSRAVQAFVLDGEMHVLYTFTPIQISGDINWQVLRKEMEALDESGLRVLRYVGLKPTFINKMAQGGTMKETTDAEIQIAKSYRRFYTALQLRDLCNELPIYVVAKKYDIPRGAVQSLAQTCQGFAAGIVKFCERMGWGALAAALDHMSDRLKAGARSDLLALAQVTYIKSRTARIFWENGFKTVAQLAAAEVKDIMPVLLQAQPRKPRLHPDDEVKYQQKLALKAEIISKSASKIWERSLLVEYEEE